MEQLHSSQEDEVASEVTVIKNLNGEVTKIFHKASCSCKNALQKEEAQLLTQSIEYSENSGGCDQYERAERDTLFPLLEEKISSSRDCEAEYNEVEALQHVGDVIETFCDTGVHTTDAVVSNDKSQPLPEAVSVETIVSLACEAAVASDSHSISTVSNSEGLVLERRLLDECSSDVRHLHFDVSIDDTVPTTTATTRNGNRVSRSARSY